jgi:hypothetical protein
MSALRRQRLQDEARRRFPRGRDLSALRWRRVRGFGDEDVDDEAEEAPRFTFPAVHVPPPERAERKGSSKGLNWPLIGGATLVGGGFLLWYFQGQALQVVYSLGSVVGFYPDPTSRASAYSSSLQKASQATGVPTNILAAIGDRESLWGAVLSPKGPTGTGDSGNGLGLMQLDQRYNFIPNWQDPDANVLRGAQVYQAAFTQLQNAGVDSSILARAAADAYNAGVTGVLSAIQAGQDPDSVSTGGNYGTDVMGRAAKYSGA